MQNWKYSIVSIASFRKRWLGVCLQIENSFPIWIRWFASHQVSTANVYANSATDCFIRQAFGGSEAVVVKWFGEEINCPRVWTESKVREAPRLNAAVVWVEVSLTKWFHVAKNVSIGVDDFNIVAVGLKVWFLTILLRDKNIRNSRVCAGDSFQRIEIEQRSRWIQTE